MNQKAESTTVRIKANPERWQRLKNILADALEQTSFEQRTALLRQSCADDTELFRQAEKLLSHDTTAFEEFAEFAATRLRHDERDRIGQRIGAYATVRQLGRGGMGAVYLAERADGQFEKQVAIKVLKRGTDTDEVLHRFRIERQILANLDHPNITRLLDAGITNDGLPYFVMEFIEGTAITHFVQQENVDLRSRLKLFLKVCSAVALAHRNQIIHRDIKPTNVLVKRDGEPKLLDFGIAKLLTEDGDITVAAERRLTPLYASPEQNAGQSATIASDVYSLGALLYELLTAQPPRRNSDSNPSQEVEFEHLIASPLPSQVVTDPKTKQQLQGQLDQIVATAMRRDPARRYSSAADLSEDIERYLNGAAPRSDHFSTATTAGERGSRNLNLAASSRGRWYIAASALAVIVTVAAVLLSRPASRWIEKPGIAKAPPAPSSGTMTDTVPSIAVLPFENLSGDPENAYFTDGIQEEILMRLAKIADLKVVSRTSTARYKSSPGNLRETATQLGVANILEGSVQRTADRVHVNVQLIKAATDAHLWAEAYDRKLTDIFAVESEIAKTIAETLQAKLTGSEERAISDKPTADFEAHQLYLKGRYLWNRRTGENLKKALAYFEQAAEKDPSYALAYAGMADSCALIPIYAAGTPQDFLPRARAAAQKAVELDDTLAEAHASLAYVFFYDFKNAQSVKEFERAISLNPNYATAHLWYGLGPLSAMGEFDRAIAEGKRALELDPVSPIINADVGTIYTLARRYDEAIAQLRDTVEMNPQFYGGHRSLGWALELKGATPEAIAEYQKAFELSDDPMMLAMLARVDASIGKPNEARQMLGQLTEEAKARYVPAYAFAMIYLALGEKDQALDWLEKAARDHDGFYINLIKVEPALDPLRGDPRFEKLASQTELNTTVK
jgi:serine/threonine protein kinase/tetratricopeptide (TPR) repeat protein